MSTRVFSPGQFWATRLISVALVAGAIAVLQFVLLPYLDGYDTRLVVLSMLFAALAVSLNLINGVTGQFSIGHAAFWMVGAYAAGKLSMLYFKTQPLDQGSWLVLMCVAGAVAAGLAGFVVGLPSLRLRGDYLAIVTLGFGEIARIIVQNQDGTKLSFFGLDLGGSFGMTVSPKMTEVWHVVLLLVFVIAISRNVLKTAHGLSFLSIREDELAAEATGVNTTKTKVTAFVVGAALAGMAGALFSHYEGFITPTHFDMNASFIIVAMVVIGGTGSITGAAVAGIVLTLAQEALRKLAPIGAIDLIAYILAAILIVTLIVKLRPLAIARRTPASARLLTAIGFLGCIAALYSMWLVWSADTSSVIKVGMIATILGAVASMTVSRVGRAGLQPFGLLVLACAVGVLLRAPIAQFLHNVSFIESNLGTTTYSPSNLRMAIFAFALVVVMLVRPQGLFGHHEFSWDFVKGLAGKKTHTKAVEG